MGRDPKYNGYRASERQVIEALEESSGAYEEVFKRAKASRSISRPTYNKALNDLKERGDVEKYYDEKKDKVLYRLSAKASDPVESVYRHLNTIQEGVSINHEKWKKCLSKDVLVACKKISAFSVGFDYKKERGTMREGPIENVKFNEMVLLKSLARYDVERQNKSSKERQDKLFKKLKTRLGEKTKLGEKDLKFPTLEIIKELSVEDEFEGIVELLRPLLEGKDFAGQRGNWITPHERNLAALYFKEWKNNYGLEWRSYQQVGRPSKKERMIALVQNTLSKEDAAKLIEAIEENEELVLKVLEARGKGDQKQFIEAVKEVYPNGPFYELYPRSHRPYSQESEKGGENQNG